MTNNKGIDEVMNQKLDPNRIPHHVAIIMDGNGRWAKQRHLPRIVGHKHGMEAIKPVALAASHVGVKVLTLYAFSTENWRRPAKEVNYIMSLPRRFFNHFIPDLIKNNVQVRAIGYLNRLPQNTRKAIRSAVADTKDCDGMVLNFAVNYGGRDEIVTATKQIAAAVQRHQLRIDEITPQLFAKHLMTGFLGHLADPDLLIRTSGEERISNFLLWQIAYSEFVFRPEYWPDFDQDTLIDSIAQYQQRHRRFGGLKNS